MRVIGVLDLMRGYAVHARAGHREHYQPVRQVAGLTIAPGDPLALARAYIDRLTLTELYVADLDAIASRAPQAALVHALAALGAPTWLDAGISSIDQALGALAMGATHLVVGLETLSSFDALTRICGAVGGERVAFSLDLRAGEPMAMPPGLQAGAPPEVVAARAADAGARTIVAIDLARVGMGAGLDLGMVASVREAAAGVTLLAGGGVASLDDLGRLADAGCDGALVATALQDGRLDAAGVAAARRRQPSVSR